MANNVKAAFLEHLSRKYGETHKLNRSQSLFVLGDNAARIYTRYSKVHSRNQTFYGLRQEDLRQLEGHPSFICFLWDNQREPLIIPFADYEALFHSISPASDGQYKVRVYLRDGDTEMYVAQAGRFNVEGNLGWSVLKDAIQESNIATVPELSHSQIQTLLGAIGTAKGYDIWIPASDRGKLDWTLTVPFTFRNELPYGYEAVKNVMQEVDVIWTPRGSSELSALFEVEHSTPIYSGLLRFNDVHLVASRLRPKFSIVADNARRDAFAKQLNRPTFRTSGLADLCTFLDYVNVLGWYERVKLRSEPSGGMYENC